MRQRLAAFMHSVARALERKPVNDAARRADDARAIQREAARSYADEAQRLIDQRNAEIEREIAAESPESKRIARDIGLANVGTITPYTRKLRGVK